jgi:recombination protein RecA
LARTSVKTSDKSAGQDRRRSLDLALAQIEKNHGRGAIMRFGEVEISDVGVIPTGSISLDAALGIGGVPRGRIAEIFGPESSGKTTLALHLVANSQRQGGLAAYIDAEHAMDPVYTRKLGVNLDDMLISQPDSGEQALDITEQLARSNSLDIIVIDSVAALVPRAELNGEMGDSHVGLQARLMSQALRKLTAVVAQSKTALVFINQIREKIGVMFGSNETTSGGRALKFYSSVRIDVRRVGSLKDGDRHIGNRVRAKVAKNKCAPPFATAEFDLLFGEGISFHGDLIDLGVAQGIVGKSGSWLSYNDQRIGQGRENARQFLKDNAEICAEIEAKVREKVMAPFAPARDGKRGDVKSVAGED